MNGNHRLPTSWVCSRLADLVELNPRLDRSGWDDSLQVSFVPMAVVEAESGLIDVSTPRPFGTVKKGYTPFLEGDIVFAKITPCMENGKLAVVPSLIGGVGFGSTEFHVLRPPAGVDRRWVFFYLLQPSIRRDARRSMTGSAGQLRVPEEFLASLPFPIAPVPEQRRIVEEIEKQFTRLDAGVAALKRVEANLRRYKAAVLKAAVEGRLTERWRAEHPDVEPASELLKRILTERRRRWEQSELAKMQAKGKRPTDDRWKKKYKEPTAPDTDSLPPLPNGWTWTTVDQVAVVVTKGSSPGWQGYEYVREGVLFIRSQNVRFGRLDLEEKVFLSSLFNDTHQNSIVCEGDVLLNLVGASVGRSAIASSELNGANTNQAVGIIRTVPNGMHNRFLMWYLLSPAGQCHIHGTKADFARANFNLDDVRPTPIPLPPLQEQIEVVDILEAAWSSAEGQEAAVEQAVRRASRLRQSILKRAFEGKLVPQDPTDEPASALLDRIKAEMDKKQSDRNAVRRRKAATRSITRQP